MQCKYVKEHLHPTLPGAQAVNLMKELLQLKFDLVSVLHLLKPCGQELIIYDSSRPQIELLLILHYKF